MFDTYLVGTLHEALRNGTGSQAAADSPLTLEEQAVVRLLRHVGA